MKRRFTDDELFKLRNFIPIDRLIEDNLNIPSKQSEGFFRFLCPLCNEFQTATNPATNLFFMDAAHFVFAPFLGYLWCFARLFIKAPSGRKRFNIDLLYLPAYSPSLNLIERMWKLVKKKCLYSKYYSDFESFSKSYNVTG